MISTLSVITPATARDLTTLDAAKAELSLADASADTALAAMIAQASAAIGSWCRRPEGFGRETVAQTVRRMPGDPAPARLILDRDLAPAVTSVTADGAELGPDEWALDGSLLLRLCCDRPSHWRSIKTVITYTAGYDLPAGCPADLARACLELVTRLWHAAGRDPSLRTSSVEGVGANSWSDPDKVALALVDGLPAEIAARLSPYKRWSV
ncbi:hypothetical protein [Phaeospirillum tilakii]|uniref:Phage gp6-like head-tail connector protein n=1 Tax=Phaeospirillum tilakii TaxID=741673 RepID=A0ABW5CC57_9PROT